MDQLQAGDGKVPKPIILSQPSAGRAAVARWGWWPHATARGQAVSLCKASAVVRIMRESKGFAPALCRFALHELWVSQSRAEGWGFAARIGSAVLQSTGPHCAGSSWRGGCLPGAGQSGTQRVVGH